MFRIGQIITATELLRNFRKLSRYLSSHPQPVLITQPLGHHLVLVNADIFEDLVARRLRGDGVEVEEFHVKDFLKDPF